jgi:hypothetical protein
VVDAAIQLRVSSLGSAAAELALDIEAENKMRKARRLISYTQL